MDDYEASFATASGPDATGWCLGRQLAKQSPILVTTITVDRLKMRGYVSLLEMYRKISPQLNTEASELYPGIKVRMYFGLRPVRMKSFSMWFSP